MENFQNEHIFCMLGGDKRQAVIAENLITRGHRVKLFALDEIAASCAGAELCADIEKAVEGSSVILLPLPTSRDDKTLAQKGDANRIDLQEIIRIAKKHRVKLILGGMLSQSFKKSCEENGIAVFDYFKTEKLQMKNALPSAEGALMIAMENTDVTVCGMRAMVCGFGRIGRLLSNMLKKLGANVTVAARRDEVLCEAAIEGFDCVRIARGSESCFTEGKEYDVIFNTVPAIVFGEIEVCKLKGTPIYIEIASKPGGIEASAARDRGLKVINAPSLPGRYAPVCAGRYIFEAIADILAEGGMII